MAIFVYPNSFGMPWEDREMDHIMLAFDDFLRQHSHPLLLRTQQQQQNQEQQQEQEQKQQQQSCKSCPSDQNSYCEEKENKSSEKDGTNGHTRHRNYKSLTDQIFDEFLQFYQGGENSHRNQSLVNKDDRVACSFCSRNQKSTPEDKENKPLEKESASLPSRQNNRMNQTKRMFDDFLQLYNDRTHPQESIYLWNEGDLFPVRRSTKSPFEVRVNLRDCDPDKVQVEVKDGILKVEGRKESEDGSSVYVKHERNIPKNVSPSSLRASFLPNGILRVIGQEEEEGKALPITMEKDSSQQETKKEQVEPKTENQDKEEEKRTQ